MQFLRGDFSGRSAPLRPPWALEESRFLEACDSCSRCVDACPTHILKPGRGEFPEVKFSEGECLFCEDCLKACPTGALNKEANETPWSLVAEIDSDDCIAFKGVECRSCFDPCEPRAVRVTPRIGGVSIPHVNETDCSGCGACFAICPSQAIRIRPLQQEEIN